MASLFDPAVRAGILARLDRLLPNARPRWGTLTPQRMLCHLADSLRISLGELDAGPAGRGFAASALGRWLVIDAPLPWPHGLRVPEPFFTTPAEPGAFERDRMALRALLERFSGPQATPRWGSSPLLGALAPAQWARLNARHCRHHLRQFGLMRLRPSAHPSRAPAR